MPLAEIPRAFQQGVGDTLGLHRDGYRARHRHREAARGIRWRGRRVAGADRARSGERRLDWALLLSGFIIGLPVFFQVGLVLLAPVLFTLTRQTGIPLLRLGIPLVAGLSAVHGLTPPHPGPLRGDRAAGGRHRPYAVLLADRGASGRDGLGSVLRAVHQPRACRSSPGGMADQLIGHVGSRARRRRSARRSRRF